MALLREPMVSISGMLRLPKIVWRAALVALVSLGLAFYFLRGGNGATHYVTAKVTRGPIVRSVIATGTVNPVVTVQVGSYVSGPIQAIYADFNAPVKANQLIAKIDPRPFQVKVAQSQAKLDEAQVNLAYTNIVSPVDGTVVSRNVDVGQTVASSFQTPTLFLIAKDLTRMQVDTN